MFLRMYPNEFAVQQKSVSLLARTAGTVIAANPPLPPPSPSSTCNGARQIRSVDVNFSLKDRVGSVVKKAMADNVIASGGGGSNGNRNMSPPAQPAIR